MAYQAPGKECRSKWPKTSGFDPREWAGSIAPMLILENTPNHTNVVGSTWRHALDQTTLWWMWARPNACKLIL